MLSHAISKADGNQDKGTKHKQKRRKKEKTESR